MTNELSKNLGRMARDFNAGSLSEIADAAELRFELACRDMIAYADSSNAVANHEAIEAFRQLRDACRAIVKLQSN